MDNGQPIPLKGLLGMAIAASPHQNPYFAELLAVSEREVDARFQGQVGLIKITNDFSSANNFTKEFSSLARFSKVINDCGALLYVPALDNTEFSKWAEELFRQGKPTVSITLPPPSLDSNVRNLVPYVATDNRSAARKLAKEVGKQLRAMSGEIGLIQVVYVQGDMSREDSKDRIEGFREGIRESRLLTSSPEQEVEAGWSERLATAAAKRILGSHSSGSKVLFCAANDVMALGIRSALYQHKRAHGISAGWVIGFDAIDEVKRRIEEEDPFLLGTVEQDLSAIVDDALMLIESLEKGVKPKNPRRLVEEKRCILGRALMRQERSFINLGPFKLCVRERKLQIPSETIALTKREVAALTGIFELAHRGHVVFTTEDLRKILDTRFLRGSSSEPRAEIKVSEVFRSSGLWKRHFIVESGGKKGLYSINRNFGVERA